VTRFGIQNDGAASGLVNAPYQSLLCVNNHLYAAGYSSIELIPLALEGVAGVLNTCEQAIRLN
jgi:hypothetical protein